MKRPQPRPASPGKKTAGAKTRPAEKPRSRISRTLKMISRANQLLVRAEDEAKLLREMCRVIVKEGGYRMAWVGFAEQDEAQSVRPVASAGFEKGYLETLKITWADTPRGRGPTGAAVRTGKPATCRNMLADPKFKPWRTEAIKRGYQSSLVLPLRQDHHVFGAISIYAPEPDAFDAEEKALLIELADNLAFGIAARRNRVEREQARAALGRAYAEVEKQVQARTAELAHTNEMLRSQIQERARAQEAVQAAAEEWRRTFDAMSDLVFLLDSSHRIVRVNRAAAETLGSSAQESVGQHCFRCIHGADQPIQNCPHAQTLADGQEHTGEVFEPRLNRHYLVTTTPLLAADGKLTGSVHVMRDITERKQAEEELKKHRERLEELVAARATEIHGINLELQAEVVERQQAEAKLRRSSQHARNLLDTSLDPLVTISPEGKITDVNEATVKATGLSREKLIGTDFSDYFTEPEKAGDGYRQVFDQGFVTDYPLTIRRRDGNLTHFLYNASVYKDASGQVLGVFAAARDVTERIHAEEAQMEAEKKLEEQRARAIFSDRLRSLGEMAAGIAHELNQPLLGVRGLAEHTLIGMQRGWETNPAKIKDRIQLIMDQADRMTHIIERVRSFARGADSSELLPVDVNEVIRSGIELMGAQFRSRGLLLETDLAEPLPRVLANPFSLEEVVLNLITNARDATEERLKQGDRSRPPRILIRTRAEGDGEGQQVKVEVSDQGVGIAPEALPKLYDPFFTTKAPDKGTGLGLPITKSLVEGFGGRIHFISQLGKGTTVSVVLPAMKR